MRLKGRVFQFDKKLNRNSTLHESHENLRVSSDNSEEVVTREAQNRFPK
jgi:hypothetical protein